MFNLQWLEPIFILNNQQQEMLEKLEGFEVYFCLLRHEYLDNTVAIAIMVDLFFYLYEEEPLMMNSEMAMIYLLRHFVVDTVISTEQLRKTKRYATGFVDRSIIAAAHITNIFLDIHRKIRPQFTNEEVHFMWKFMKRPKKLFDVQFQKIETYPRKLVMLETRMLQAMRSYMNEQPDVLKDDIQVINRFMDAYVYDELQLFCRGIIK